MSTKHIIVAALIAGAILAAIIEFSPKREQAPIPDGGLSLRGKWIGPNASEDAMGFAGLCRGLAEALEVDGKEQSPRISTGVSLEDLRVAASRGRFLPRSLSRDQPHAVAASARFLDEVVGTSGGPIDATTRQKWIEAFRALQTAAEESVK